SNPVKLIFLDTTLAGVEATKGTLATLEFSVPTDAVKDFDLTVDVTKAADATGADITIMLAEANGKISVIDEVVEPITWPGQEVLQTITYGDELYKAFKDADATTGAFANGKVNIDTVDYDGKFYVRDINDVIPATGDTPYPAKAYFKVDDNENYPEGIKGRIIDDDAPYYNVTVNKAPLTVTVADASKKYGAANPTFTATAEGLVNGDEIADLALEFSCAATEASAVGEYDITATSANTNYDITFVKGALTIAKALASAVNTVVEAITDLDAETMKDAKSVADLITALVEDNRLHSVVEVAYEGDKAENANVTWSSTDEWVVKGGKTYNLKATITSDTLDVSGLVLATTATVATTTATLDVENISKTFSKAEVEAAVSLADLAVPASADLEVSNAAAADTLALVYDKTLEDVKAAAANVTDGHDEVVTINLDVEASLTAAEKAYLTVAEDAVITLNISNKKGATIAAITATGAEYGTEIADIAIPAWTADDAGEDADARVVITYVGKGDTVYEESTTKPTAAGTYTAKASLVSDIYAAAPATADFEITKAPITLTVKNDTRVYGDANPTPELAEAPALKYDDTVEDLLLVFTCDASATTDVGEYPITVAATNANYSYSYVPGTLTITKKSIADVAPVLNEANAFAGLDMPVSFAINDTFEYEWTVGGEEYSTGTEDYLYIWPDYSNKAVTVKAVATEATVNYEGTSAASNEVTVAIYDLAYDVFSVIVNDNNENDVLDAGDLVVTEVPGFYDASSLGLTYVWTIGDVTVPEATDKNLVIPAAMTGVVEVTGTPNANYTGTISATVGEIGKIALTGEVILSWLDENTIETGVDTAVDAANYDLIWVVDGVDSAVTGTTYAVTNADLGKTVTAKLVGKGDNYSGIVLALNTIYVEPLAPSNVVITTDVTKNSIDVEVTADANGAEIEEYALTLTDSEENVIEEAPAEIVEGVGTYTFENLDSKTTYTITVVAINAAGETEATATATTKAAGGTASVVTGGATGTTTKPTTPPATETPSTGETETPSTGETETPATPETTITVPEADVVVESKTETATVPAADLADASVVSATVTTESGATVEVTVDVAEKAVDSLTVSADKANTEVTGKAADGIVGDAIEVKVDAKSGDTAVAVEATIAIDVEAQAYAYAVDELGNTVRLDSAYDAETGKLLVAGVADGTVVAVSTTAPVDFADTADRWSHKEVARAADLGIVSGRAAGAYAPADLLTRSEASKLKMNLADALKLELTVNADVKIDTDPSHWAYEADLWAAQTGISVGVGAHDDGTIITNGEDHIIRQDYLTKLARLIKLAIGDVTIEGTGVEFADAAHIADYAKDSIALLSSIGILKGSEGADGVYANPKADITREEAAALSNRAYEFVKVLKTAK
ncbi:MAG: S-layer homology domain-containing protein, partial [Clostridia bacterium]|nr:S-layer homology domain-containing protein [Clostridia bacterium]